MSSDTSHISKSSLSCARSFLAKKKYGRSFANFLLFIKLSPHKKEDVLDDFIHCMTEWTNQLVAEDRMDDLFKCYDQACEILPACESVLNNIGAQLFRYGHEKNLYYYAIIGHLSKVLWYKYGFVVIVVICLLIQWFQYNNFCSS